MSYESWGRNVHADRAALPARGVDAATFLPDTSWLPFGNGRSYGDSCHNDQGTLLDCRSFNRILGYDEDSRELTCEPGVLLSDILAFAMPKGLFLPVTPGTRFVSVAGAIANDVHGKNHHRRGTFGMYVSRFTLQRSDGTLLECSSTKNSDYFAATIGGMGLTGLIVDATIRLIDVSSPDVLQRTLRFDRLDDYFKHCDEFDETHEYAVAWIDQLAKGQQFGRGILMGADHAAPTDFQLPKKARISVPFTPPMNLINSATLTLFNALYWRKVAAGEQHSTVPWSGYFYPLDAIGHWNRLYGPRGLFQHQSVYPADQGHDTTVRLMKCAQDHGHASFLTVLKRFGSLQSPGIMSFPKPGFTLTLDFSNQGAATLRMLNALDQIVIDAGGAVNPYKDGRMSADTFRASFPDWQKLETLRDPAMMSDFWRRTACETTE